MVVSRVGCVPPVGGHRQGNSSSELLVVSCGLWLDVVVKAKRLRLVRRLIAKTKSCHPENWDKKVVHVLRA